MQARINLFEFEDLEWFPKVIRNGMTDVLRFMITKLNVYEPIVPLIYELLEIKKTNKILDLCSGGGGGIIPVQQQLEDIYKVKTDILLSDKFPNIKAYKLIAKETNNKINFIDIPLNATMVKGYSDRIRTIFSSFHHFDPATAKKILQDAVDSNTPIGVFEGSGKTVLELLLAIFIIPFVVLIITPFIKPFKWSRLFFTYVIPAIPLCTMWDGFNSVLRMYTPEHLAQMTRELTGNNFTWKTGRVKNKNGLVVTYLVGYPKN